MNKKNTTLPIKNIFSLLDVLLTYCFFPSDVLKKHMKHIIVVD